MYSKLDVYIAQHSADLFVVVEEGAHPEDIVPRNLQDRLGALSLFTVIDADDKNNGMPEIMRQAVDVVQTKGFFVLGMGHESQPH